MKKSKKQERIDALSDKALALLRNGKHEAALESFAALEELEPEQPDWPRRAAECLRGLDDKGGQIEALGRAAERYSNQSATAKAIAMLRMILNLDPGHQKTRARLLELQGATVEAPPSPPQATPELPQRRRLVAPPPAEKPEPPAAVKADGAPRPRLERILRQRRAASRDRRPPAETQPEPSVAEREPIVAPIPGSVAVAESGPATVAETEAGTVPETATASVAETETVTVPETETVTVSKTAAVAEPEPKVRATEPLAATADALEPEPEIVPDELEISSIPAPKASVPAAPPSANAAAPPTPVPPSDEAVTLRPPEFAPKATEPAA